MLEQRIGFLGAGQMAEALIRGWLQAGVSTPDKIIASDVMAARRELLGREWGIATTAENREVARQGDLLILAVKPHLVVPVLEEIREDVRPDHLVVSIAAGVPLRVIEAHLPAATRAIRVMPNTPCLVGAAAAGFARGSHATDEDEQTVQILLDAVGRGLALEERLLDAVTGLSGSGPAFVYVIIEALADGGVRMGLPRSAAQLLAAQTVLGAARMVLETGQHPAQLKDAVASPGGTTIAGLQALERGGLRAALMDAVQAATLRSQELGALGQ
jgi:pyrroline-5-carboxylate reductase